MSKRRLFLGIIWTFAINGVLPLIVYVSLKKFLPDIMALSIATLIPVLDNTRVIMRERRADVFGLLMILGFLLGVVALLIHGGEQLLLVRESLVTGVLGLVFLGSLLAPRPLIYYFVNRFTEMETGDRDMRISALWSKPRTRRIIRVMTAVWGLALTAEATIRVCLVYVMSTTEFLILSPFIQYGIVGLTAVWTVWYRRLSSARILARK